MSSLRRSVIILAAALLSAGACTHSGGVSLASGSILKAASGAGAPASETLPRWAQALSSAATGMREKRRSVGMLEPSYGLEFVV